MTNPARPVPTIPAPPVRSLVVIGVLALVVGVLLWPYAIDVIQATSQPELGRTAGRLLVMAVGWSFVAAGLIAWRSRPGQRVGKLLVATGWVWLVATVKAVEVPPLWTLGQIIDVAALGLIAYVLLAFPEDRLGSWWHRIVVALVGASVISRPVGLVVDRSYDGLNVLSVREIPGVPLILEIITMGLVIVGLVALAVTLGIRWGRATRPARRVLAPMLLPGMGFATAWAVYLSYQLYGFRAEGGFDPPTTLFQILILVFICSLLALPVTFLLGLARTHARRARVGELARAVDTDVDAGLQQSLRRTLGDDSMVLAFPLDGEDRWVAADGAAVELPDEDDPARAVTFLRRRDRRVGAVLHDPALRHDEGLLESVTGIAALAVDNERLAAEVQARLAEVRASRARLVAAGDEARRRIERDLHDGAQQRLLSAALALRTAQAGLNGHLDEGAGDALEEAAREISTGLSELRDLARGIHPAVLTDQGLGPALRALAGRSALSVDVAEVPAERLPAAVEAGAYFVACEALANAAKHARATRVRIGATVDAGTLVVAVTDDGRGGAELAPGGGLAGLVDRVDALDGSLDVTSPAGAGTTVTARLPITAYR